MFFRLAASWEIVKLAYTLLGTYKHLVVFPVLSAITMILMIFGIITPLAELGFLDEVAKTLIEDDQVVQMDQIGIPALIGLFGYYFANFFIIIFFNTAMVACVLNILITGDDSITSAFKIAFQRIPQIIGWSMISALVGVILEIIENTHERIGRLIAALLGAGWNVLSYFVIPLIVMESHGPFKAFACSSKMVSSTWGSDVKGVITMRIVNLLINIPGLLLIVLPWFSNPGSKPHFMACMVLTCSGIVWIGVVTFLSSVTRMIFNTLVYLYASEKPLPEFIERDLIGSCFEGKRHFSDR